jgi:hypothetical protein
MLIIGARAATAAIENDRPQSWQNARPLASVAPHFEQYTAGSSFLFLRFGRIQKNRRQILLSTTAGGQSSSGQTPAGKKFIALVLDSPASRLLPRPTYLAYLQAVAGKEESLRVLVPFLPSIKAPVKIE